MREIELSRLDLRNETFGNFLWHMVHRGDSEIRRIEGIRLPKRAQLFRYITRSGKPFSIILKPSFVGMPDTYAAPTGDEHALISQFRSLCSVGRHASK